MPRTPNETVPSQFRLSAETLAHLDTIAARLTEATGITHSRTDAVRRAAKDYAARVGKKARKKS